MSVFVPSRRAFRHRLTIERRGDAARGFDESAHARELERVRAHTRAIERASGTWSRRGLPGVSRDWSEWRPRASAETRAPRSNETYDAYARYVERRDAKTRGARRLLLARGEAEEEAEA